MSLLRCPVGKRILSSHSLLAHKLSSRGSCHPDNCDSLLSAQTTAAVLPPSRSKDALPRACSCLGASSDRMDHAQQRQEARTRQGVLGKIKYVKGVVIQVTSNGIIITEVDKIVHG